MRIIFVFLCLCLPVFAEAASDVHRVVGVKFPNSAEEGLAPVSVSALSLAPSAVPQGFTEMLPFILRAPDQEEAGSCLYMSLTGIAEWWMAKLNPGMSRSNDGPLDFSERYLMNIAGVEEDKNGIANWKTDSIFLFNSAGGTLRNRDYRFTKGWFTEDKDGNYVPAAKNAPGAEYDARFNWIDRRDSVSRFPLVPLPKFQREVFFADPESNQWNTGTMPSDIVERVKTALRTKKAPVLVIYNHFGYWHANFIVGFDDQMDNKNCEFVRKFLDYMPKQAADRRKKAAESTDAAEKEKLLKQALKFERAATGTKTALARNGGCHAKGAFYVRDSIYGEEGGPIYDYDPSTKGEEAPYVKTTVLLEYDWLRTMANHATQITLE